MFNKRHHHHCYWYLYYYNKQDGFNLFLDHKDIFIWVRLGDERLGRKRTFQRQLSHWWKKNLKFLTPKDFLSKIYSFHHNVFLHSTNLPQLLKYCDRALKAMMPVWAWTPPHLIQSMLTSKLPLKLPKEENKRRSVSLLEIKKGAIHKAGTSRKFHKLKY